jgi:putative flippase GtrA
MPIIASTLENSTAKRASSLRPRGFVRLVRAAASSVAATVISQLALLVILGWGGSPTVASAVAFVAGAVPNYLITRRWVWRRRGKPRVRAELVPYLVVIAVGGLGAVGLTTVVSWLLAPLTLPHVLWVVLLDFAYVSSYAVVFVVKFTLLDRLVFGRGAARTPATKSRS